MQPPLYYVGTADEVAHHARPLAAAFDLRIVAPDEVVRVAQPGEACVFFNEYFPRFRDACLELKAKRCPTLYAIDGILEWRNSWELPENGNCCLWVMRPVLSHKVACVGRSQARILESWGNLGKCEVVGVPRFDTLARRPPREPAPKQPLRVLILTAKCPGFDPEQVACTTRSLLDLKQWFDRHPRIDDRPLAPIWRITQGLEKEIGVTNQLHDTTGKDLATVLQSVDAVITTPSTAMLEGMLHGLPVALLDYHNRPHYVPAAWRITAGEQFDEVLPELFSAAPDSMLYQDSILHDSLECHTAATPRLIELIEQMQKVARHCIEAGQPLAFPRRMLRDAQDGHHLPEAGYDHARLFPARLLFSGAGRKLTPSEAAALAQREGFSLSSTDQPDDATLDDKHASPPSLDSAPLRRKWAGLNNEIQGVRAQNRLVARLERELREARREIQAMQRQTITARLDRLRNKILRLVRLAPRETALPPDQSCRAA